MTPATYSQPTPYGSFSLAPYAGGTGPVGRPIGDSALSIRQADFRSIIARQSSRADPAATPQERARAAAEDFVSISLIQPLLAQLRNSNHAAPPFAPSNGERQFQSMMDAQVARQIVRASKFPLVERVARDLLAHSAGAGTG